MDKRVLIVRLAECQSRVKLGFQIGECGHKYCSASKTSVSNLRRVLCLMVTNMDDIWNAVTAMVIERVSDMAWGRPGFCVKSLLTTTSRHVMRADVYLQRPSG